MGSFNSKRSRSLSQLGSANVRHVIPSNQSFTAAVRNRELFSILLQGPGEAGKSTLLKQLQIMHSNGFDIMESKMFGKKIIRSLLNSVIEVLKKVVELSIKEECQDYTKLLTMLYAILNEEKVLDVETARKVSDLINDVDFMKQYEVLAAYLPQNLKDCLKNLTRFPIWGGPTWTPTNEEILCLRSRTVGVNRKIFASGKKLFAVIDVGGQKTERRKYLSFFDDTDLIVFVTSLSNYDLDLFEERGTNRFTDALELFGQVCSRKQWSKCPILLYLNKFDAFKEKYENKIRLPQMKDQVIDTPVIEDEVDENYGLALEWFRRIYLSQAPGRVNKSDIQVTVAINQQLMKTITSKLIQKIIEEMVENFNRSL